MGLFRYLFGFNLTAMDEKTIARGVQIGIADARVIRERSRLWQTQQIEKHNREIAPTISAAREYEKSFMLVNNAVNRSYGHKLMFNPMMEPLRMNEEQRQRTFAVIAELAANGSIAEAHAERMRKYLHDLFGKQRTDAQLHPRDAQKTVEGA